MAVKSGRNGEIKLALAPSGSAPTTPTALETSATSVLGQVRSWSLDESVETVDATVMNASASGYIFRDTLPTFKTWTATVDFLYDPADTTVQFAAQFVAGATVDIAVYPEGELPTNADKVFGGRALLTSISRTASYDGLIECSATFEGKATLVAGATTAEAS